VIQEWKLVKKGWDVDLSQIRPRVIYIWHGSADKGVSVGNTYRNAKVPRGRIWKYSKAQATDGSSLTV
jgi:hypothetical protein